MIRGCLYAGGMSFVRSLFGGARWMLIGTVTTSSSYTDYSGGSASSTHCGERHRSSSSASWTIGNVLVYRAEMDGDAEAGSDTDAGAGPVPGS